MWRGRLTRQSRHNGSIMSIPSAMKSAKSKARKLVAR